MPTSEGCLAECGYNIPAEIHSIEQRDALVAYTAGTLTVDNYLYLGKYKILFFRFEYCINITEYCCVILYIVIYRDRRCHCMIVIVIVIIIVIVITNRR